CGIHFGGCIEGQISCIHCEDDFQGNITAKCEQNEWKPVVESCVSPALQNLVSTFKPNTKLKLPVVLMSHSPVFDLCQEVSFMSKTVCEERTTAGNIATIVNLLDVISQECFNASTQDYSKMANHILNSSAIPNWSLVPQKDASPVLLHSMHTLASSLASNSSINSTIRIHNDFLHVQAETVTRDTDLTFQFNSSTQPFNAEIFIKKEKFRELSELSAVGIGYSTLGNILPSESENLSVNGLVMSVAFSAKPSEIGLRFEKVNKSSDINTHCAAWDQCKEKWLLDVCRVQVDTREHVICMCNYSNSYLSFSILMSQKTRDSPVLYYITIIGLGISIGSLFVCLAIEVLVWRNVTRHKTAYMRHVSIVNIAISLLLADIWFIVNATTSKSEWLNLCIASTFFTHFFYLSLFFWMLIMGLLILYGIFLVYHDMNGTGMLGILFLIGYGCPFVISILTLAITLNKPNKPYTRDNSCWLNWEDSKALLAFIVPSFTIIAVNAIITCIVIMVLLRPSIGETPRTKERSSLIQISRCVAILTPLLGLTWGIGVATILEDSSEVFHYLFTILNGLQ
ncbi:hypothetical protein GDO86_020256, partial [Hymenochirus boettgeri]